MTSALVAWSRITTKKDSHSQLLPPRVGVNQTFAKGLVIASTSSKAPRFAGPVYVGHAAAAKFRMVRVLPHIRTLVPAAHAFRGCRRLHRDPGRIAFALHRRNRIGRPAVGG